MTNNQDALHPFSWKQKIQKKSVSKDPKVMPIRKAVVLPHASAVHPYSFTPSHTHSLDNLKTTWLKKRESYN